MTRPSRLALFTLLLLPATSLAQEYRAGLASVDITPDHPIRLNGFGFRRTESEGVTQPIFAKALAIEDEKKNVAVLITVDVLGIPDEIRREIAGRLKKKSGIAADFLAITATHTHTGPMLSGQNQTLFSVPIPREHLANIDKYTKVFTDRLEEVALKALEDRKPAKLSWGIGKVTFAVNRRTPKGPVDHDLPVLFIKDPDGKVRGIHVAYACHCVTLSNNKISGDWAGYAQDALQRVFPGAVALVSVGCGADSNPSSGVTGAKADVAAQQGAEIATEVQRLARGFLTPLAGPIAVASETIPLPLVEPKREEWEAKAKQMNAVGHHARVQLEKLHRGEKIPTKVDYPIQTWTFGDGLAMVFLPGEVVVDYSLRLKRELDGRRLWINAYANDDPCYIPSERILKEGGYEGGGAMVYYDLPGPFLPGLEQKILDAVVKQIGKQFPPSFDPKKTKGSLPLSPQQSWATLKVGPKLAVDLVAAEPLVTDPVAIDFGPDGKLWVVEMLDYPSGASGKFEPGGRVRYLEDTDQDGLFDRSTTFLENIPFPTGILVWRKGVLVCAAPDILYAEDNDGDGKADGVKKLYSGFGTENYQARVNSLCYGLDGWVYGSCGLFGGNIDCFDMKGKHVTKVALGNRDFRIKPDLGLLEPVTGTTQQGRGRDDWGNWFACDNSTLIRHYVLEDRYLKRNPHVAAPPTALFVPGDPNPNRLFALRSDAQRFKLSGPSNSTTAACGLGIYRDNLLGEDFTANSFTCEPVNLVVHRLQLTPKGSTFVGKRAKEEQDREFLASTDNWFRPVQARTGPDGALWVVDMYRFVIEHPRWIPKEDLAELDTRAGHGMGRLYRVRPKEAKLRPWLRLDRLKPEQLVEALDSPNGWRRDMAMQMLLWEPHSSLKPVLVKLFREHGRAETRLQALCVLEGWNALTPELLTAALSDKHPGVKRHAMRMAESFLEEAPELAKAMSALVSEEDGQLRLQLAYTGGQWRDPQSGKVLAGLAKKADPQLLGAILSSVNSTSYGPFLEEVLREDLPPEVNRRVLDLAAAMTDEKSLEPLLERFLPAPGKKAKFLQMASLGEVLDGLNRRGLSWSKLSPGVRKRLDLVIDEARAIATTASMEEERLVALPLLGLQPGHLEEDRKLFASLLGPGSSPNLQAIALMHLSRGDHEDTPGLLLKAWRGHSPKLKSQVLDVLLSRPAWTASLLSALEGKQVPVAEMDLPRRQRLLTHRDDKIREQAGKLFRDSASPDRGKVIEEYHIALKKPGHLEQGKKVFAKTCSACHRLDGIGFELGPDLAALANRPPQYLLNEILDPNRNLDSRHVAYRASTLDGRIFDGMLVGETAISIILRAPEGKTHTLLRANLEDLTSLGRSLMPEGLEKEISPDDMANLLKYLTTLPTPAKHFPGNNPEVIRIGAEQAHLRATQCTIHGEAIVFEPEFKNLGYWSGQNDRVVWRVQVENAMEWDVYLDFACDPSSAGNMLRMEGGDKALEFKVPSTGAWSKYQTLRIGSTTLGSGEQRIVVRPAGPVRNALLDLRTVILVPKGQKLKMAK